jgi:perosamine synthetase
MDDVGGDMDNIPHSAPTLSESEAEGLIRVLRSGHPAPGPERAAFESELARMAGVRGVIAVQSGSAALHLALEALDVSAGDAVMVPSYCCAAVGNAIEHTGAEWIPADVDAVTGCLTAETVRAAMTDRIKAIIAPHMLGGPCDIRSGARPPGDVTGPSAM